MPEYRAYIVGSNGHIRRRIDFLREEDDGAKAYAKQLVNGHDVEVWQGGRRVAAFEHRLEKVNSSITREVHRGQMIPKLAK